MLKHIKVGLTVLAVSALYLAPVATVTFVSADAAYANNGKGNGNSGNAGNNGNKGEKSAKGNSGNKGATGSGNSSAKSTYSKSKGKSAGKGGFGKELKSFGNSFKRDIGALFGKKPAKTKVKARTQTAAYTGGPEKDLMHSSNLGKLNGAIHSSPRAKQAHIENGLHLKGTGPVSLAAALAVADHQKSEAERLTTAYDTVAGTTPEELQAAQDAFSDYETNPDSDVTEEEYNAAVALVDSVTEAQETIDAAAEKGITEEDARAELEAAHQAVEDAEDNLLLHYKGDLPPSEDPDIRLSEGEQSVVDAVRESNPDDATVSAALDSYNARVGSDDDSSDDSTSGDEVAEEDDSEAIENSTVPPMLRNASVTEG